MNVQKKKHLKTGVLSITLFTVLSVFAILLSCAYTGRVMGNFSATESDFHDVINEDNTYGNTSVPIICPDIPEIGTACRIEVNPGLEEEDVSVYMINQNESADPVQVKESNAESNIGNSGDDVITIVKPGKTIGVSETAKAIENHSNSGDDVITIVKPGKTVGVSDTVGYQESSGVNNIMTNNPETPLLKPETVVYSPETQSLPESSNCKGNIVLPNMPIGSDKEDVIVAPNGDKVYGKWRRYACGDIVFIVKLPELDEGNAYRWWNYNPNIDMFIFGTYKFLPNGYRYFIPDEGMFLDEGTPTIHSEQVYTVPAGTWW